MVGDPVLDPVTGLPQTRIQGGVLTLVRGAALVDTAASEGEALGLARKSRLMEIMSGQILKSSADARTTHPNPPNTAPDHSTLLNRAEKRLLAEWMDLGGKYYNDPFDANSAVRVYTGLSQSSFVSQVYPILMSTCAAGCHQPVGSTATGVPGGTSFSDNRFVLAGDAVGDYNTTLSMISNTCSPSANSLLMRPSTAPHAVVLPVGSSSYNTIANWIATGC
jgi:hypothetical protein